MKWTVAAVLLVISTGLPNLLHANDFSSTGTKPENDELMSGRDPGETVPQFYVRAVTGPLRNKSICYVCRNGSRPVAMVLMQKLDPKVPELLKEIDDVVDRNRAAGLKSFGVLICDEPSRDAPKLQTLAYNSKISIPLTVGTTVVAAAACQNVHPDAATTVVLYDKQKVVSTYAFREGELENEEIQKVIAGVRLLAGEMEDAD